MTAPGKGMEARHSHASPHTIDFLHGFLSPLTLIYKVLYGHMHVSRLSWLYMNVGGVYAWAQFVMHGRHP
jgi:hypothetical protein